MEEASGLKRMLELKSADGKALHTMESIATSLKLSVDSVSRKIGLTRLAGTQVGAALDAGDIQSEHARLIAQVPTLATRLQVLEMVLKPTGCPAPMPVSELRRRLTLDYVRELRGAPWKLDDAGLVPVSIERGERVMGGACVDCPWNVASDGARKTSMCMSPECYRAKEAAVHARWVAEKEAAGKVALAAAENAKVFGQDGVKLSVTTDYVDLDEKPDRADLGAKSDDLPTWGKLVKAAGVPVVLALDAKGKERALVRRDVATAAIEELDRALPPEKQILESSAKPQKQAGTKKDEFMPGLKKGEEEKARVLKEKAAREIAERIERAELAAIVTAARVPIAKLSDAWLGMALTTLAYRVDEEELGKICVRRGWSDDTEGAVTDLLLDKGGELPQHEAVSLLTELLLAGTQDLPDFIGDWAAAVGVDLKKVRKAEEAAIKAETDAAKRAVSMILRWSDERANVEDFEWCEKGCKNPSCAEVPAGEQWVSEIQIARHEKGWVYGYFAVDSALQAKGVALSDCQLKKEVEGTKYGTRKLAICTALSALQQQLERAGAPMETTSPITVIIEKVKGGAGK